MSTLTIGLSPENTQFLEVAVARGIYPDKQCVIDKAVELLRRHQDLIDHLAEGTKQVENGEFQEYGESDLETFRTDIAAARKRLKQRASP